MLTGGRGALAIGVWACLACGLALATEPYVPRQRDPLGESWRWRTVPGFRGEHARALAESSADGVLWAGTASGLLKHDGYTRTRLSSAEIGVRGAVVAVLAASDGTIWAAGSEEGVSRLRDGVWSALRVAGGIGLRVGALVEAPDGAVWAADDHGAIRFTGLVGELVRVENDGELVDAVAMPGGAVWFVRSDGRLVRALPRADAVGGLEWQLHRLPIAEESPVDIRLSCGPDGTLWAVAKGLDGVCRFRDEEWSFISLADRIRGPGDRALFSRGADELWVAGEGFLAVLRHDVWRFFDHYWWLADRRIRFLERADGTLLVLQREGLKRWSDGEGRWTTFLGLRYQCEEPPGTLWFVEDEGGVVSFDGRSWVRHDGRDGLVDSPAHVIASARFGIWALGSHHGDAAVARFDGEGWRREVFPEFGTNVAVRSTVEASDRSIVLVTWANGRSGGVLRFDGEAWTHWKPPVAPRDALHVAETADGVIWIAAGGVLHAIRDGEPFQPESEAVRDAEVSALCSSPDGELWVATSGAGLFCREDAGWRLVSAFGQGGPTRVARVRAKGAGVIVESAEDAYLYENGSWSRLPVPGNVLARYIRPTSDGSYWIRGLRYRPDSVPPRTRITRVPEEVPYGGEATISWEGIDRWGDTPSDQLQFSWRLDGGEWSRYTYERRLYLDDLSTGSHTVEVRARDADLNEEALPVSARWRVAPPIWARAWFVTLVGGLLGLFAWQWTRAIARGRQLAQANSELERARVVLERRVEERTAELLQAQKLEAVGRLAAGIAHDFNNCLTAIDGFAYLARERALDEEQRAVLSEITQVVDRAAGLTRSLLTYSSRSEQEKASFDLRTLVDDLQKTLRRLLPAAIEFRAEHAGSEPLPVNVDPIQLAQVLMNLAVNARDAMPLGGVCRLQLGASEDRKWAVLSFSDTGKGISEDIAARIFEPFFTTKPQGTGSGLGLSIVRSIVAEHGGTIEARSDMGRGASFEIRLPIHEGEVVAAEVGVAARSRLSLQGVTVLIGEDDARVRSLLVDAFREVGCEVIEAADGEQCSRLFEERHADVRAVVLDLDMPKKHGLACLREIRGRRPDLPVILASGSSLLHDLEISSDVERFEKPYRTGDVVRRVAELVGALGPWGPGASIAR